jgi:hypothetical protein
MTEEVQVPTQASNGTPTPAPAEIPAEEKPRFWTRPVPTTALILQPKGDVEVLAAEHELVQGQGGTYRVETRSRFWLAEPIPVGWLSVFVHNDPEPVTDRAPVGYNAKTLELLVGPYPVHVIGGGFQGRQQVGRLWVWLLIIAVVLAAAAAIAIWMKGGI